MRNIKVDFTGALVNQYVLSFAFLTMLYLPAYWFLHSDKQLIQYTTCPLMAFLDGCTPLTPSEPQPEEPADLLDESLETKTPRSSLIRLEPLTEAEANEATLFYLCELNSDLPNADMPPLDI